MKQQNSRTVVVNGKQRRLVNLYRNQSGLALVLDGFDMMELTTGVSGHDVDEADEMIAFVRSTFPQVPCRTWLKGEWRRELAAQRTELKDLTGTLPALQGRRIRATVREGWGTNAAGLLASLVRLTAGNLNRQQCRRVRDLMWDIRALELRLASPIQVFDLDSPLPMAA